MSAVEDDKQAERAMNAFPLPWLKWRVSLGIKSAAAMALMVIASGAVALAILRAGAVSIAETSVRHGLGSGAVGELEQRVFVLVLVAFVVHAALVVLAAGVYGAYVPRGRLRVLVRGLERVAQGDFDTRLPVPPEPDFEVIQRAFDTMRLALARSRQTIAHQDSQRRRLFADLAHDLATPVSTVLSLVDTLRRPDLVSTQAEQTRMLGMLETEVERLARLVADIRDLAHLDDPDVRFEREPADLAEVVARASAGIAAAPRQHPIHFDLQRAVAPVDPVRVEQLVQNLLANAIRHAGPASHITVRVEDEADEVLLTVEDDGVFITDDVLERLGERFYRPDASRDARTGGLGLGLSIVAAIVARHEGAVRFVRNEPKGLRVHVRLPKTLPSTEAP